MNLGEMEWKFVKWIDVAQVGVQGQVFVNIMVKH
jgi:hypothetical protein